MARRENEMRLISACGVPWLRTPLHFSPAAVACLSACNYEVPGCSLSPSCGGGAFLLKLHPQTLTTTPSPLINQHIYTTLPDLSARFRLVSIMVTNPKQPQKGILKKPAQKQPAVDPREIALQHARIIQHRKDLEAQILDSLILLSEYPLVRGPQYSATQPAPSDAADFKAHIRLFQPSDYDDLIIERNVNELCGYTLCPKPRRNMGPGGEWKITGNGEIVKRKDLEMWCSQQCARMAMYVKVQLNETAAWERAGIPDIRIELMDEDKSTETEADRTARKLGDLKLEDQRQAARDTAALALERGEPNAQRDKVEVTLKEKEVEAPAPTIITPDNHDEHLMVEGFKTKLKLDPDTTME
ncbi:Rtr1/RPAP2 family-domain-containing protein [Thelonectria olida]|uniref:RNA polymerase II subunit B1 CTD phosphatase RPAP2 homolog n=1 Tax=Thelonectria olida TaxID=1576542 RepID=A0A9P9AQM1_9HYPO|nr:Rtr1/RPAP2 family-domain-containing protein [Thelonectria olida]